MVRPRVRDTAIVASPSSNRSLAGLVPKGRPDQRLPGGLCEVPPGAAPHAEVRPDIQKTSMGGRAESNARTLREREARAGSSTLGG